MKRVPPIEKVYEAWSALADSRVRIMDGSTPSAGSAEVVSSDGKRVYNVRWIDGGRVFSSTDNATFWRGYPGYPVIAVMMKMGFLPLDVAVARLYGNVNWKAVNTRFRNDYASAVRSVDEERHIDAEVACGSARKVMEALERRDVEVRRKVE